MVYQLVYVSRACEKLDTHSLDALLSLARENNSNKNITGMLLYHEGSFIQVLEGAQDDVEALYDSIRRDSRHRNAIVVLRTEVADRAFDQWSMGYKRTQTLADVPEGFHHFLQRGYRQKKEADREAARKALLAFRDGRWRM